MKKKANTVAVICRRDKDKNFDGLCLVFPEIPAANNPWTFTVWDAMCGHGGGVYEWYRKTKPVSLSIAKKTLATYNKSFNDKTKYKLYSRMTRTHRDLLFKAFRNSATPARKD